MNTHNFESVLAALSIAQTVNDILQVPSEASWVCFSRRSPDGESATATIAFRWPLLLDRTSDYTTVLLPAGPWRNALTGADVDGGKQRLDALLADAPVALLERA
jgi:maltooligosyltrehalose synthase